MTLLTRRFTSLLAASTVVAGAAVSLNAMAMDPYLESTLVGFCKATMQDDVTKLNRSIHRSRINYDTVAAKVVCNQQPIVTFAQSYGATRTFSALSSRLPDEQRRSIEIRDLSKADSADPAWSVTFDVAK